MSPEPKKIAIIPARGGSKRIPRKNIRMFHGLPMIAWSIRAAQNSGLFDKIIVSTDDAEISGVAIDHGAEVPFVRPEALSNDQAGTTAVIVHALQWFAERGEPFDAACCIYATAPFLEASRLMEGWESIMDGGKRYAFSVTSFAYPIQRALRLTAGGGVEMFQPEHRLTRSQDLEVAFHDAGQFYWGWSDAFTGGEDVFSPASAPVMLPRALVHDIDTPEDWERAELAFAVLKGGMSRDKI